MLLNLVIGLSILSMFASFRLFNKPMVHRRLAMSTAANLLDQSNAVKTNTADKEFKKNMKLGVLFLNLGGPETLKVKVHHHNLSKPLDTYWLITIPLKPNTLCRMLKASCIISSRTRT